MSQHTMNASDADWVYAALRGDRDAFGALVDRNRARAVGLAMAMLGDVDEAEDVAQQEVYQAYFGLDRLRDPARFGAWLCGIAVNLAKMALRRRRMTASLEDFDGGRVARGFGLDVRFHRSSTPGWGRDARPHRGQRAERRYLYRSGGDPIRRADARSRRAAKRRAQPGCPLRCADLRRAGSDAHAKHRGRRCAALA